MSIKTRPGNSLIGFLSKSLKRFAYSLIFGERPERFAYGCSFLVDDLSDLLTSLIYGEPSERFAHIAHQKRGNE